MKAQELRLGNLIYNSTGSVTDVSLLCGKIISVSDSKKVNEIDATPIPLTKEWLLKFGFIYKDNGDDFDTYSLKSVEVWEHDEGFCHSYALGNDVLYVHQLQNLYFALTGEELTAE